MNNWTQLERAISIATIAHAGQFDKGGKPYILHPFHLMNQLMFDPELAEIAILHDTIEDTSVTIAYLKQQGFSLRVTDALELLTHIRGVPYEIYIEGVSTNYDALRVKRKDLQHNSDIIRLKGVTNKDIRRIEKYHRAYLYLGNAKSNFRRENENGQIN